MSALSPTSDTKLRPDRTAVRACLEGHLPACCCTPGHCPCAAGASVPARAAAVRIAVAAVPGSSAAAWGPPPHVSRAIAPGSPATSGPALRRCPARRRVAPSRPASCPASPLSCFGSPQTQIARWTFLHILSTTDQGLVAGLTCKGSLQLKLQDFSTLGHLSGCPAPAPLAPLPGARPCPAGLVVPHSSHS